MSISLSTDDLRDLSTARQLLENQSLAARMTHLIGTPINKGLDILPNGWQGRIGDITQMALNQVADAVLFTPDKVPGEDCIDRWHKRGATISDGARGLFGVAGLAVELPISTKLLMCLTAAVARSEGESLRDEETRRACMMVFALGGEADADDAAESRYYTVRRMLTRIIGQAADNPNIQMAANKMAPATVRLIALVADRYGIQVTEKVAALAIPGLGAAGGALVNALFIEHFQDVARGHFIVRRLERRYGVDTVRAAYLALGGD